MASTVVAVGLVASACAPDPPMAAVGIVTDACDPGEETGSGIVIGDDLVLTSAHVLAGADAIDVVQDGRRTTATVIAFDPDMDLAYLRVEGVRGAPLELHSEHVERGDEGVAYVVRGGEVIAEPIRVRRRVNIRTEDIYVEGETLRPGFELDAAIETGDSGGAVVVDGTVIGIVWARSRRFDNRAYAIDPNRAGDRIDEQLATGEFGPGVDPDRCH